MKDFHDLAKQRRSIRKYTEAALDPEQVELILSAALRAPTSRNRHSVQFVVVEDAAKRHALSRAREHISAFVAEAPLAIVVLGDPTVTRHWVEDAAIAATYIQLQAADIGLGSCWYQVNNTLTSAGQEAGEYVRQLLNIHYQLEPVAVIAIGNKAEDPAPRPTDELHWEKIHLHEFPDIETLSQDDEQG